MRTERVVSLPLLIVLSAAAHSLSAQTLVIQGANVVDVISGSILPQQTIVIKNGTISSVGPASSARFPAESTVIDAAGKFVIPGLADMHDHIATFAPVKQSVENLRRLIGFGITTVFSPAL